MARIVALDYGRKRIGIATTDALKCMALPYKMFEAKKELKETVKALLLEFKPLMPIEKFIIGLPLELSGKEGLMAQEVKQFALALGAQTDIPYVFWDERLTSAQVDSSLKSLDLNRKKRAQLSDAAAASIILDSYLCANK